MASRTGFLVDEKGTNLALPAWPFAPSSNGAVALFKTEVEGMLRHAAHYHEQNSKAFEYSTVKLAKPNAAPPLMPNNQARLAEARKRQAMLAQTKRNITDRLGKLLGERDALAPFRFDPAGFPMRQEMRQLARGMSDDEKMRLASADPDFAEALVEGKPFMSGIALSQHGLLREQALRKRHGARVDEIDQGIAAGKTALATHEVISKAINNELQRIGEPVVEVQPKPPSADNWQLLDVSTTNPR